MYLYLRKYSDEFVCLLALHQRNSMIKNGWGGVGLERGLRLITQFQRKEYTKWRKKSSFAVEKPGKYHLNQEIKVNLTADKPC